MKTLRCLIATVILAALAGCATAPTGKTLLVQPLLDRIVPADFRGDGEFSERGQYLVLDVRAGDLHKNASGQWTWAWLEYRRTVNIPLAPGVPYKQEGWIRLGTPTTK